MKKFWRQYRIFIILMGIVLLCMIAMGIFAISLFFKSGKDKYGDRLNNVKDVKVTEKMKDTIIAEANKDNNVLDTNVHVSGKIIYITLYLDGVSSVLEAEGKAINPLNAISEDVQKKYDIQFILIQEKTEKTPEIKIMGSKNVLGNGLVWNNNTEFSESEE
ncbi:MAG: hypothetical protein J5892_00275 [Bacilli bacterium]|nr:hypothetical protein [Bacilli bacterium]